MALQQDFMPTYGSGQVLTGGAGTANSPLGAATANTNLRVGNSGTTKGYFRTYNAADAAGTPSLAVAVAGADVCVTPGLFATITKPKTHDSIAYIGTGATFEVIGGEGM